MSWYSHISLLLPLLLMNPDEFLCELGTCRCRVWAGWRSGSGEDGAEDPSLLEGELSFFYEGKKEINTFLPF